MAVKQGVYYTSMGIAIDAAHLTKQFCYDGVAVKIGPFDPSGYPEIIEGFFSAPSRDVECQSIFDQLDDSKLFTKKQITALSEMSTRKFILCIKPLQSNEIVSVEEVSLDEAIEKYLDKSNLHSTEGSRGIKLLAKLARALGYEDRLRFGQLGNGAVIGDIIEFLEDNSGAIEAVVDWVKDQNSEEWRDSVIDRTLMECGPDEPEDEAQ